AGMARKFRSAVARPSEVTSQCVISGLFQGLKKYWEGLDGLVHAIAFTPREAIAGDFLEGIARAAFAQGQDISAYSFAALAKGALPMMRGRRASLLTLTYLGAERV